MLAIALVAVAARLPTVNWPMLPDEAGFSMVAAQWHQGSSLYGNYWVDRPPLLIAIFGVVHLMGGSLLAIRALGLLATAWSVLAAGWLGNQVAGLKGAAIAAATAGVFLTSPTLMAWEVNGELLAVPLVLTSVGMLRRATSGPHAHWMWAVGAGATGLAAAMVKQNFIDGLLAIGIVAVWRLFHSPRRGLMLLCFGALGALGTAVILVWFAASRGTTLVGLWDAVVTFRAEAASVVSKSSSPATALRFKTLMLALAFSGVLVPLLLWLPGIRLQRDREWVFVVVGLMAWETFGVVAGASYWLHYLVGLVPALVLMSAAIAPQRLKWAYTGLTAACLVSLGVGLNINTKGADPAQLAYLKANIRPGDTATIAFGKAELLQETGLSSPYKYLWSLPVRVRDPHLRQLRTVIQSPSRPTWLLLDSHPLRSWGISPGDIGEEIREHYTRWAVINGMRFLHSND